MVALLLLVVGTARAEPAVSVAATGAVVGAADIGIRPGLRVGYEPVPEGGIELAGDLATDLAAWDTGLSLVGRLWLTPDPGQGVFLSGRATAGIAARDDVLGPWTGLHVGFGARPTPLFQVEATGGPEWAVTDGPRWRTELSLGFVLGAHTVGSDSVRHGRIRKVPTE
ncbi:MAG: hypothetical protein H6742_17860 [Alphaproteobacteria bacterium]|nr:hypothetical protein [Alphaproteobacteria bacterium]